MRNKIKLFILFLFLSVKVPVSLAQDQRTIDSLNKLLKTTPENLNRISILLDLSSEYQSNNTLRSFECGNEALQLAQRLNDQDEIGTAHNKLGDLYWYNGDYAASSDNYFKALKIFEGLKDQKEIANCYRNIGWIYLNQKNYSSALESYNKSKTINQKLGAKDRLAQNYNDMGSLYAEMKKWDLAISSYQESLKYQDKTHDHSGLAVNYGNMGVIYRKMGETNKAVRYFELSLQYALEKSLNSYYSITGYCNVGSIYTEVGKVDEGIKYLKLGLDLAKKVNYKDIMADCYKYLGKAYASKKDLATAYQYSELLCQLKDTMFNEENNRQVNQMTVQYETKKKELTINSLEKDKAVSNEKLEQEKKFKIYLIAFCLLIAAFAFFLLRNNVQRKKTNKELSSAYHEIELKNKDITDSINYSKRIQDAILPPRELKIKMFPDAFVFFKPKDIVSGDFYWFAEKNGERLIAACDCTGHGVPGALMSMVGNNILNQIVNEKNITQPNIILDHLNDEIRKSLKQNELSETRDGMDIAMLKFTKEGTIEYSGAQRPLWIIRNSPNNSLEEIKPDKFSIGGLQNDVHQKFTNHSFQLQKGDCVYIFSDGYVDQFGGPDGKKFMSRQLKDTLLSIHTLPMLKQEDVLAKKLEQWRGNKMQVDDVLVIGIRV